MLESHYQSLKAYGFLNFWAKPVYSFDSFRKSMLLIQQIKKAGSFLIEGTPAEKGEPRMKNDAADKIFFSDDARYADLINGLLCNGRQVLKKEDLMEHSESVHVRTPGPGTTQVRSVQGYQNREKVQDIVRKAALGVNFILIGLENQETVDYSLPLRCMEYETGQYEKQAARIRRTVKSEPKGLSRGEYLYGFKRDSRLFPSIILVLYYGEEDWDGPVDLHGLLDFTDIPEEFRKLVQNYQIHLVEVRKLENTDVFKTDVKLVFDIIRNAGDKEKRRDLGKDTRIWKMEDDAREMLKAHIKLPEVLEMKIYEEYKEDVARGYREWEEEERNIGREEGREEGKLEGLKSVVLRMNKMGEKVQNIVNITGVSVETVEKWINVPES